MPTIAIALWKRLEYTKRVFDGINNCLGVDNYTILAFAEPDCKEVVNFASSYQFNCKAYSLTVNAKRLGCGRNIHQALSAGFDIDDYVVMVEDDIVLASDALKYFEHCKTNYRNDSAVFSVCGYTRNIPSKEHYHCIRKSNYFTPYGWATWSDRWTEIDAYIKSRIASNIENSPSWDTMINKEARGNRAQIEPLLARAQNIGAERGAYCPSKEWHAKFCFNEFGAWSVPLDTNTPFIDLEDV